MEEAILWSPEKNASLKERHGFGFERVIVAIEENKVLDVRDHPNKASFGHQRQMIVEIENYAWVVPFVFEEGSIFLKTMFPSRTANKFYRGAKQ